MEKEEQLIDEHEGKQYAGTNDQEKRTLIRSENKNEEMRDREREVGKAKDKKDSKSKGPPLSIRSIRLHNKGIQSFLHLWDMKKGEGGTEKYP